MIDTRSTDPNVTGHRRARFHVGWRHAVSGRRYSDRTLNNITWQNTGWRLGKHFGETGRDSIDGFYEVAVTQQAEHLRIEAEPIPAPEYSERFPSGFPIRDRFPNAERVRAGEGEAVSTATKDGRFQIIVNSGGLADFLDLEEDSDLLESLVTVHHFSEAETRDSYLATHYPVS